MDQRIEDLFPLYALDALTDEERAQVDAYVAANPEARSRLAEMMRTASALPYDASPVEPSPVVKASVMNRIGADVRARSASPRPNADSGLARMWRELRSGWAMPALAGLSMLAAALAIIWAISLNGEVVRLRDQMTALNRELSAQRDTLVKISAPGAQAVAIAGTEHQPDAHGQLIADPAGTSAVLVVSGLARLGPGEVYQFWLIRGDAPVSAGLFRVDEQGLAVLSVASIESIGSFDAMGVSIEPEGGSAQPTGDIVMLGRLS